MSPGTGDPPIDGRHVLIVPTAAGVLLSIGGREVMKPLDAEQLLQFGRRFIEAAAERLGRDRHR